MPSLGEIFREYGQGYLDKYGDRMPPTHREAIWQIASCQTEQMGGSVYRCLDCEKKVYSYHSCFNRSCPQCGASRTEKWLEDRYAELLPVPYFHVIFTVPEQLRRPMREHQQDLYDILMKASAWSVMTLCNDPKFVGGKIGVMSVLQTWTKTMIYHPHVHSMIPGGGVCEETNHWIEARQSYLVPVKALSVIFRGIFHDLLETSYPHMDIPEKVWRMKWNVYCKAVLPASTSLLDYLARYLHRVAITNSNILEVKDDQVTFQYREAETNRRRSMTLDVFEFMRRFLQHVLPKGFHKIRYYGLWSPPKRQILHTIKTVLPDPTATPPPPPDPIPDALPSAPTSDILCPHCGSYALLLVETFPRQRRAPPSPSLHHCAS